MNRDALLRQLHGSSDHLALHDVISEMNRETNTFVEELAAFTGLEKYEAYYFFLGRLGNDFRDYAFNWEPFRNFAGPLLRGPASLPVVMVSDGIQLERPVVEQCASPRPHYQVRVARSCAVADIANVWLELLEDDSAIPQAGGKAQYHWFLTSLSISPEQVSAKAVGFLNKFASVSSQ